MRQIGIFIILVALVIAGTIVMTTDAAAPWTGCAIDRIEIDPETVSQGGQLVANIVYVTDCDAMSDPVRVTSQGVFSTRSTPPQVPLPVAPIETSRTCDTGGNCFLRATIPFTEPLGTYYVCASVSPYAGAPHYPPIPARYACAPFTVIAGTPGPTCNSVGSPSDQTVTLTNTGTSAVHWNATVSQSGPASPVWLSIVSANSGTIAPGGTAQIRVHLNKDGLQPLTLPTTYSGTLTIFGDSIPHAVPVSFTVN